MASKTKKASEFRVGDVFRHSGSTNCYLIVAMPPRTCIGGAWDCRSTDGAKVGKSDLWTQPTSTDLEFVRRGTPSEMQSAGLTVDTNEAPSDPTIPTWVDYVRRR